MSEQAKRYTEVTQLADSQHHLKCLTMTLARTCE